MAVNQIRVSSRTLPKRARIAPRLRYAVMALLVSSPVLGILGFDYYSGRLGVIWPKNDVVDQKGGRVIKVPPGGNLQGAIDSAQSGDVVELQAGAVYSGQINLSNKPLTDYVTIRSSGIDDLPANKRVTPGQRGSMATIQSGMMGRAAVMAANGAHHYRFIGIEFTPSSSMYNYGLVQLGHGEFKPANVPHDIEIDRSYIHPFRSGVTRRGIALNSANTTIKNSYIEGIAFPGEETQGICGWSGTRNVKILNNYIEAGAENIMFGGSDPDNADLIPSDIEVRGNTLNKPAEWKGKATVKALFEIKNAKRLMFAGNLLTNNWEGSAFRVTVRDQDGGAPFSTIEDVTIRDNVIKGAGEGINILGRDDTYPSQTLQRLVIANNLFLDIGGKEFEGSGYFIQIAAGNDITIANNTVFNLGNITTFYGDMPTGFVFRNNVTSHGNYGVHGLDVRSEQARAMYLNNVFMNLAHVGDGDTAYPQGNAFVRNANDVGFVNISDGDYRIDPRSKYSAKGCDLSRFTPDLLSAIH